MSKQTIQQPPVLSIDQQAEKEFGRGVEPRGRIERRVVWNLLVRLGNAGFHPTSVDDGEEVVSVTTLQEAMELVFNLDEARIRFKKSPSGRGSVLIVLGNDGWDCVSDWSYQLGDPDGFDALMQGFDGEEYA